MLITRHGFKMFTEGDLDATLQAQKKMIYQKIEEMNFDCKNTDDVESDLLSKFTITPITIDRGGIVTTMEKAMIPAKYFPGTFMVDRGQSYEKSVAVFKVPLKGEKDLLKLRPSTFMMWTEDVDVEGDMLVFESIIFKEDAEEIKKGRDEFLNKLEQQFTNINGQVEAYNFNLKEEIGSAIRSFCSKKKSDNDLLAQLNS